MEEIDVISTPESDAKTLSDRELLEAIYVQQRAIMTFVDQLGAVIKQVEPMIEELGNNPMLKMLFG